jgi:signal recognition particle receptor subunit beta
MAFFDPERRRLTLRLVYDGLGTAGKTTNVRQAHALFTLARRGRVIAPVEHRGRTLFFDWLELDAGFVDDWPLRCQVLTVPGQFSYAPRRYELLRSADAVVLVCDSTPPGLERSRHAAAFLARALAADGRGDVPVVVQANKQDVPGALRAPELAAALGLGPGATVIEASATTGGGVRATLVLALQAARDRLRDRLRRDGPASLPTRRETPALLYAHLQRHDVDAPGAALADDVIARFLGDEAPPDDDDGAPPTTKRPPPGAFADETPPDDDVTPPTTRRPPPGALDDETPPDGGRAPPDDESPRARAGPRRGTAAGRPPGPGGAGK